MNDFKRATSFLVCSTALLGCSSAPIDPADEAEPQVTSEAIVPELVYAPRAKVPLSATSLAFNPTIPGELWLALRQFPSGQPCTLDVDTGCSALPGAMAVISDATGDAPSAVIKQDGNAWHFMRRPSAIAWGEGLLFSTCGETLTDNYEDDPTPYAGPVLWSSDPAIFGVKPAPEQNGTHLDMLHETPFCMGIAHEAGNAFWAVNGNVGALDRVDFHAAHPIGGDDHSDGEVHRYITGQLLRVPEVPSQLVYDGDRQLLYVADTGHGRVLSVDPSTAQVGNAIVTHEALASSSAMDGATVAELVPSGLLRQPSGIALASDVLYVTDNATSLIHTFDVSGRHGKTYDTALPAGSLGGIALGPDQKLYVTDLLTGSVYRLDMATP